jgi:hypothetical protein
MFIAGAKVRQGRRREGIGYVEKTIFARGGEKRGGKWKGNC